jgi:hypothetical protein
MILFGTYFGVSFKEKPLLSQAINFIKYNKKGFEIEIIKTLFK